MKTGLLNHNTGTAKITAIDNTRVTLAVTLETPPPPPLPLTMLLALPRPKMLRRILQVVAATGVKRLYLINSYRVEKSYWLSPLLNPENIRKQLLLGLEQSRDTLLPEVTLHKRFKPFVEDELPALCINKKCFIAHPSEQATPCPRAITEPSVLAIGPEGGFIPYEVQKLNATGFQTISLGQRILKVETALPALLYRMF